MKNHKTFPITWYNSTEKFEQCKMKIGYTIWKYVSSTEILNLIICIIKHNLGVISSVYSTRIE